MNNPTGDNDNGKDGGGPSMLTLLVVAGLLVAVGWYLSTSLRHFGNLQDCAMQGRTNCAPLPDK